MKVLHLTATYPPSINGVAISISKLKKELDLLKINTLVVAPENPLQQKKEKGIIRFPSLPNPLVPDYPIPLIPDFKKLVKILRKNPPDIVHVHHPFHVGYFAKKIADYFEIPLVFTYHTRYEEYTKYHFKFLPRRWKKIFIQNNVEDFCRKTDLVISPAKSITAKLLNKIPYLNIATIPSGLPFIPKVNISKQGIRKLLNLPGHKIVLLTVCRLSEEKNLSLLIKSLRHLNSKFLLLIVGGGNYEKQLWQQVLRYKVDDKIRFIGPIEHQKLGIYYQAADIFLYPSYSETQGLVYLEALSFGLPIVSVKSDAAQDWVSDETGILSRNNPSEFTKAIINISTRQQKNNQMRRNKLINDYSIAKSAKKIVNEYRILNNKKSLSKKLLDTGWQSWSPRKKSSFFSPAWNNPPKTDEFLPIIDQTFNKKQPVIGWCSYYENHTRIFQEKIIQHLEWFSKNKNIPVEYILIDEGWTKIGDWKTFDPNKFPQGIKYLSQKINDYGYKSGIWVAPFWSSPDSVLARSHPDWMVKDNLFHADGFKGLPLSRYFIQRHIMDVRKPSVMNYLFKCLDLLLKDCNFKLIKLDFLFSIYFIPNISTREAGWRLNNFLMEVKRRYPEVYTIACGCPLIPAVGTTDSIRIGPDIISPLLDNIPVLKKIINSYKVNLVLKNIRKRSWTKTLWNLDPDVFVCRPTLGLSTKKILALQRAVKKLDGNIFLGDDMTKLSQSRIDTFVKPLFSS